MIPTPIRRTALACAAALTVSVLAACGADGERAAADPDTEVTTSTSATARQESGSLTLVDPWVKAAESGMTAAFGTLHNAGTSDVVVTAASSDVTSALELHETVKNDDGTMAMQPKKGGFTIPAGGDHELSPGGDHLMITDLKRPLEAGERVTVTLTLRDGSTLVVHPIVKEFTGADEKYQNGDMGTR